MSVVSIGNSPELRLVPYSDLPASWRTAWWFLGPAVNRAGEMSESSVASKISTGQLHLFMIYVGEKPVGALTVAFTQNDWQKVATIVHLGGDFERMTPLFDELKSWARAHGASAFRIWGRKGWRKVAAPFGFKEKFVVMEAQI